MGPAFLGLEHRSMLSELIFPATIPPRRTKKGNSFMRGCLTLADILLLRVRPTPHPPSWAVSWWVATPTTRSCLDQVTAGAIPQKKPKPQYSEAAAAASRVQPV